MSIRNRSTVEDGLPHGRVELHKKPTDTRKRVFPEKRVWPGYPVRAFRGYIVRCSLLVNFACHLFFFWTDLMGHDI